MDRLLTLDRNFVGFFCLLELEAVENILVIISKLVYVYVWAKRSDGQLINGGPNSVCVYSLVRKVKTIQL